MPLHSQLLLLLLSLLLLLLLLLSLQLVPVLPCPRSMEPRVEVPPPVLISSPVHAGGRAMLMLA